MGGYAKPGTPMPRSTPVELGTAPIAKLKELAAEAKNLEVRNDHLETENTMLQLAVVEIYEMLIGGM